jgi:hypothetical protein
MALDWDTKLKPGRYTVTTEHRQTVEVEEGEEATVGQLVSESRHLAELVNWEVS